MTNKDNKNNKRSWFVTIQKQTLKQMGFNEPETIDPSIIATYVKDKWEQSGKDRRACVSVCISETGSFHVHAYLYGGQPTTFNFVKELMLNAHTEPVKDKSTLADYITKEGDYSNNPEKVLCVVGRENIVNIQGKRSDLDLIKELIERGWSPDEIMAENIRFRRYEKFILSEYDYRMRKNSKRRRTVRGFWHYGDYGSGIDNVVENLCRRYGDDKVFHVLYTDKGCFDNYSKMGSPKVLVVEGIDEKTEYSFILQLLNTYSNATINCRFKDIYPYWEEVHFISAYPPDQYANRYSKRGDLIKRLYKIIYHYDKDGKPQEYTVPAYAYQDDSMTKYYAKNGIVHGEIVDTGGFDYEG